MEFDTILLARLGEITLKGQNRRRFEQRLMKNIRYRLKQLGEYEVTQSQSRIWIDPTDDAAKEHLDEAVNVLTDVFGIVSASVVRRFESDLDLLNQQAIDYVLEFLKTKSVQTFKVESRRGDKRFPLNSQQISAAVGAAVLSKCPTLTVDVHEPDFVLYVEVREFMYLYVDILPGLRGLPVGMSGKGLLLLSGGIDSPVAGFMMASRGMELEALYFHTFPYTGDQAKQKVIELAEKLSIYTGRIRLHIVDFTETQLLINEHAPMDMITIVMRRMMYRVAEAFAHTRGLQALVTGESLGQVASQTLEGLTCTNEVVQMPVFRPLIGMDKDDTVNLARRIGTFETSILPYEDCCTVFVAKHPRTKPTLKQAQMAERNLEIDAQIKRCLDHIETLTIQLESQGD